VSADPRNLLATVLAAVAATEDDNATPATIQIIYEGGPENYRYLFSTGGKDVVISLRRHEEVESGDQRRIQDVPIRYNAVIPMHVSAVDKTGLTATKVLNKIRLSITAQIEANAADADYTYTLQRDEGPPQRIGGYDPLWQDRYRVTQRPLIS
jgi:hypothetical protein